MVFEDVNAFAGSPIDRRNNFRKDAGVIGAALESERAMCLVLDERSRVLEKDGSLIWKERRNLEVDDASLAFLGDWKRSEDETWACFATTVASKSLGDIGPEKILPGSVFTDLRSLAGSGKLSTAEMAIAAHAKSLIEFHKKHRFCGLCGSETVSEEGASRRRCCRNSVGEHAKEISADQCTGMWFPRTDPVVIAVVVDKDKCLLGRKREWKPGMYSALAGFMEHGESCEDAVRREIFEESGVVVGQCRYHSSQPWPFPYSLMMGFIAEAKSTAITVDENELETARWFPLSEIHDMIAGRSKNSLPPAMAIAFQLCDAFARQDPISSFDP